MGRLTFSVQRLMVATGLLALCFAVIGVMAGAILAIPILVAATVPFSSRWEAFEVAATIAWLLLATVATCNVSPSLTEFLLLALGLLLVGVSWGLRLLVWWARPGPRLTWPSVLFAPASILLGLVVFITEPGFHLRFALSEPALTSFARQVPLGSHQSLWFAPRRVGLIWVLDVKERAGGTYLTTAGFMLGRDGLVYIPKWASPPSPDYRFQHVRGPWWRFWMTK